MSESQVLAGHHRQEDEVSGPHRRAVCECGWRSRWVRSRMVAYQLWIAHVRKVVGR